MRKKLDKIFSIPSRKNKVYQARGLKKSKRTVWQYLYSLFF